MAFWTNYDGSISDGIDLPVGDKRHVFLRKLVDGIISVSDGEWLEVTSGAPTPDDVQTYASTIAPGVTNATNPVSGSHVTIYWASDPLIGSGDSRLVRFTIQSANSEQGWLKVEMMDTASEEEWTFADGLSTINGFSVVPPHLGFGTSASSATDIAHRAFVFGGDDWLGVTVYDVDNAASRGALWFVMPASIPMFQRSEGGYLYAAFACPTSVTSSQATQYGYLHHASGPGVVNSASDYLQSAVHIYNSNSERQLDSSGRAMMERIVITQRQTYPGVIGELPRMRAIRGDLMIDMLQFDVAYDSTSWLALCRCYGGSSDNLFWCVDITPDP